MDKDLIEDELYWIIDQFNENKITPTKFYSILLNEIHPFSYGNGRMCKILFANEDKTIFVLVVLTAVLKRTLKI